MYCLLLSLNTLLLILIISLFDQSDAADYWHSVWFVAEGSMALLYLFMMVSIMVLWRPTANNHRYDHVDLTYGWSRDTNELLFYVFVICSLLLLYF
mgnify:CR=1 FL=1